MNKLLFILALVVMAPIVSASISCYAGYGGTYSTLSGFDVCYTWTVSGVVWKSGVSGSTCASAPTGYSCCSTSLCNGAKINGASILMASVVAIIALFRAV